MRKVAALSNPLSLVIDKNDPTPLAIFVRSKGTTSNGISNLHACTNTYCHFLSPNYYHHVALPGELVGHEVAVWRVDRRILIHAAHQSLPARLFVEPQLPEDVIQPRDYRPIILVVGFFRRGRHGVALGRRDGRQHSLCLEMC